ncbi:Lrp/AsnC family transcriptional regulator [Amycolatopsis silviterrae]|uniref:Lrp/AsnC family transcriptional regulator n=1 Tax=Amycolatopsis silviterrae TaxID=1656914 RepID=A0ABW5HJX2_9PSEU
MSPRPGDSAVVELRPSAIEGGFAARDLLGPGARVPELDELDTALVLLLLKDGRLSNRELATATAVGETTVGVRLRRLVASRVLTFTALFDWEAAGFDWLVIAKINVGARTPKDVAYDVARLRQCEAAAVAFGEADVLAYFLATDREEINDLLEHQLAAVPGITSARIDVATRSAVTDLGRRFYLAQQATPIRLPAPVVALDSLDADIMQALVDDGRQSSRRIARQLSVSEGTVRARVNRLTSSGLMRIAALVEPSAFGAIGAIANIGLRVDRGAVGTVYAALDSLPQSLFKAVTVGSADLTVTIAGSDQNELLNAVLQHVRALPGVHSAEPLQLVDVVRFPVHLKRLT